MRLGASFWDGQTFYHLCRHLEPAALLVCIPRQLGIRSVVQIDIAPTRNHQLAISYFSSLLKQQPHCASP